MRIFSKFFTLIELIVSIAVLIIIIAILMQSLKTMQKSVSSSKNTEDIFQNAIVALDIMSRDIQSIYYENSASSYHFYHKGVDDTSIDNEYFNDAIYFTSITPIPQDGSTSEINEVKYQLYYPKDNLDEDTAGWVLRSVTGDASGSKWNFWDTDTVDGAYGNGSNFAFTVDDQSSEPYEKLIPNVTRLEFKCYSNESDELSPPNKTFPYSVEITLSVLDQNSWLLWKSLRGDLSEQEPGVARDFREKYERTFSKTILIGDRGQYK